MFAQFATLDTALCFAMDSLEASECAIMQCTAMADVSRLTLDVKSHADNQMYEIDPV